MLDPASIRRYFETRLAGERFSSKSEVMVRCCFHEDRTASLSINMEKGVWNWFAGCGEGGMISFEMKFSKGDETTARSNIASLVGRNLFSQTEKPEAVYQYQDARGIVVFEKLRYPGKR